jgi:glycosyl hydrolase family 115 (putative glucuronidase)
MRTRPVAVLLTLVATAVAAPGAAAAGADDGYISFSATPGGFPLVAGGKAAPIVVSASDHPGVVRAVGDLQADVERVTGVKPAVATDGVPAQSDVVLVGTIGKSPLVDKLVAAGKLDVSAIAGRWETSLEQVVQDPMPGVPRAFVIAGSDQRGTIFGAYDVSKGIGASPWYWWDDVPAAHQDALYVEPGAHSQGTPAVKYRGFFINDENPALGRWAPVSQAGFDGGLDSRILSSGEETLRRHGPSKEVPARAA